MSDLTCPNCDADVPDTGMSGATGIGDAAGNVSFQPPVQHARCPECGAKLERNPESDVAKLRRWRLAPTD